MLRRPIECTSSISFHENRGLNCALLRVGAGCGELETGAPFKLAGRSRREKGGLDETYAGEHGALGSRNRFKWHRRYGDGS
jgi:hypothetical protein